MNDGILLVDKPAGMSSFGVVARVRRKLSEEAGFFEIKGKDGTWRKKRKKVKVGHTGTLDPFATGLLILLVGKETKRANEFLKLDKEYVATLRLGMVSTTGDIEGDLSSFSDTVNNPSFRDAAFSQPAVAGESHLFLGRSLRNGLKKEDFSQPSRKELSPPSGDEVREVLGRFQGEILQTVPQYSAVKINGQRAYKLAREGKNVEMPRRKVKIYEIEILRYGWPELEIRCRVSSGTYIRALGEDIGEALGVGAYLTALRRTEVGEYRVEEAKTLEEIMQGEVENESTSD